MLRIKYQIVSITRFWRIYKKKSSRVIISTTRKSANRKRKKTLLNQYIYRQASKK